MKRRARAASLVGQRFGYLIVLRREGAHRRYAVWRCRCDCGAECLARGDRLRHGWKKSCGVNGHRWFEYLKNRKPSAGRKYPSEYISWCKMHERCVDKKHDRYKHYGARGITICQAWSSFEQFVKDMGRKPTPKHTIDRYPNNDGNYEPSNCRWATRKEQARNRQNTVYVEHEGKRVLLIDLVAELGVDRSIVYGRLKNGWPLDQALLVPVKHYKKKKRRLTKRNTQE